MRDWTGFEKMFIKTEHAFPSNNHRVVEGIVAFCYLLLEILSDEESISENASWIYDNIRSLDDAEAWNYDFVFVLKFDVGIGKSFGMEQEWIELECQWCLRQRW